MNECACSTGGMPLTDKNWSTRRRSSPTSSLATTKAKRTCGCWASAVKVWKKSLCCNISKYILLATVLVKQQSPCSLSYDGPTASYKAWSSVSSFNFLYLLVYLMSSSSCWSLLSRLQVSSNFPAMTCIRRQFLSKMCSCLRFIVNRIFLCSLTLCNTSAFCTRSVQLIFIILQHHISNFSKYF